MLKTTIQKILFICIAAILCVVFGAILLIYARPMEDVSLDLSLIAKEEHYAQTIVDEKGWTVYTQHGDTIKELEGTGKGAYRGIELGETFYYSRVMSEELDGPTLQIGTGERMFSVWLDEELIYTDCPELDNRIGYVTLPMNTVLRNEPIIVSLPMNYQGKTLTIAQSTPTWLETSSVAAYPASVRLYCGYAYESGIIAEAFSTAIMAAALFFVGMILSVAFVRSRDAGMLCIAFSAFLWMCIILRDASFFTKYFGYEFFNIYRFARLISAAVLMVFLTLKAGKLKPVMWCIVGLHSVITLTSIILYPHYEQTIDSIARFFVFSLAEWTALAGFIAVLVFGIVFWRKEKHFYRVFAPLAIAVTIVGWIVLLCLNANYRKTIPVALASGQVTMFYANTFIMIMLTALACALYEAVRQELARRTEQRLLEERREMVMSSYENMRRQHEEIMKLRHDMADQLRALKGFTDNTRAAEYIDSLIGKQQKIRSVVQTGNEMLDIILNNKLSEAQDQGIALDIVKAEAPEKLPISDTDLCSLVMNIMNNAVKAAAASGVDSPFIRLNIHVKNNYFAFTCHNSADMTRTVPEDKKETVRDHGWGLKIVHDIAEQYDGMMKTAYTDSTYEAKIAIPLSTP